MHSVTDKRADGRQNYGNSRSYCVSVRSAKTLLRLKWCSAVTLHHFTLYQYVMTHICVQWPHISYCGDHCYYRSAVVCHRDNCSPEGQPVNWAASIKVNGQRCPWRDPSYVVLISSIVECTARRRRRRRRNGLHYCSTGVRVACWSILKTPLSQY